MVYIKDLKGSATSNLRALAWAPTLAEPLCRILDWELADTTRPSSSDTTPNSEESL